MSKRRRALELAALAVTMFSSAFTLTTAALIYAGCDIPGAELLASRHSDAKGPLFAVRPERSESPHG